MRTNCANHFFFPVLFLSADQWLLGFPSFRPAYMIGIGGIVLAIGYGFITLLSNPRQATAQHESLPDALTPGKGVDAAASRAPSRA